MPRGMPIFNRVGITVCNSAYEKENIMNMDRFWVLVELMLNGFHYNADDKEAFIGFLKQHLVDKNLPSLDHRITYSLKFWELFNGGHRLLAVKELRETNAPWLTLRLAVDIYDGLLQAKRNPNT
jgi:hypothetical protein